jgi:hypothetical protein
MKRFKEFIQEDQMKDLERQANEDQKTQQAIIARQNKPKYTGRDIRPSEELSDTLKTPVVDPSITVQKAQGVGLPPPKPMGMGKFGTVNPRVPARGSWNTSVEK